MTPRPRVWPVALAVLAAAALAGYAGRRLIEGGASQGRCAPRAAGWQGHVSGVRIASTLPARERRIRILVNDFRAQHGLARLALDEHLALAARYHSSDMILHRYFEHTRRGETFGGRFARYTPASCIAENIAWGTGGFARASGVVSLWRASPGHRAVMLTPWLRRIGVGVQVGPFEGQRGASVATADFSG